MTFKKQASKKDRVYDVVVFGASGVTGKYVIEELWNFHPSVKWAAAGRSRERVEAAVEEVRSLVKYSPDLTVPVIEADVEDISSMKAMCEQTAIIISCVGPYRFYGKNVVTAAIDSETHYLDVCGEPQFLETVQADYYDEAKYQNIYVIGCCGFDSIPSDVGVEFLKSNFEGDFHSVETYLKFERAPGATANFATWQSAIHGFANASELKSLRNRLREKLFIKKTPRNAYRSQKSVLFKDEIGGWCVPFVGSDKSVCYRTQMHNFNLYDEHPVTVDTFLCAGSLFNALGLIFLGVIFGLLARFAFGRYLLEQYPEFFSYGVFSKSPPKRENESEPSRYWLMFKGFGWPEKNDFEHGEPPSKEIRCFFKGNDNGYVTTAICVVNCAAVILFEHDKLPENGGVFTPGVAFKNTKLLERLQSRGLFYEIKN